MVEANLLIVPARVPTQFLKDKSLQELAESLLWTLTCATNVQEGLSARRRSRRSARHCKRGATTQWALHARSLRVEPKGPVCVVAPRCIGELCRLVAPHIQTLLAQRRTR